MMPEGRPCLLFLLVVCDRLCYPWADILAVPALADTARIFYKVILFISQAAVLLFCRPRM